MSFKYECARPGCGKTFTTEVRGAKFCGAACESAKEEIPGIDGALQDDENVLISKAQLQELLAAKAASPTMGAAEILTMMKTFVEELRKPDPETAERMALEKAKKIAARENAITIINAEIEGKRRLQDEICQHKNERGRSVVGGQVCADGLYHPLCQRCGKEFTPFKPTTDTIMGTVNTGRGFGEADPTPVEAA